MDSLPGPSTTPCSSCGTPLASNAVLYAPRTGAPICAVCLARREAAAHEATSQAMYERANRRGSIKRGRLAGVVLMVLSAAVFVLGLLADRIFAPALIVFFLGAYAVIAGKTTPPKSGF